MYRDAVTKDEINEASDAALDRSRKATSLVEDAMLDQRAAETVDFLYKLYLDIVTEGDEAFDLTIDVDRLRSVIETLGSLAAGLGDALDTAREGMQLWAVYERLENELALSEGREPEF